tara:strand:+ start:632 stop:1444 length:813 start_codon:yes stop_codon:yes gene_type:complete
MELHCIGDSHTWQFLGKLPDEFNNDTDLKDYKDNNSITYLYKENEIKLYSYRCCIDGALAFNIEKRDKLIQKIISDISENNTIIFMFGEVDCRWKLLEYAFKSYNNSKTINFDDNAFDSICSKGADNVLNNYISYIKKIQTILDNKVKICLWGPHATFMKATYFHAMTGEGQTRNKVTHIFNKKLKSICKENNWIYCTLFDLLIGENYITKNFGKQYTWCGFYVEKYPHRNKDLIPKEDLIYVTNSSDIWIDMIHINPEFARDKLLSQIL